MARKTTKNAGKGTWVGTGAPGPGRPVGSRNKRNQVLDEVLATDEKSIADKLAELAKGGNLTAIGICADYLWAKRKPQGEPITLDGMEGKSIAEQGARIVEALAAGELTTDEATAAMAVVSSQARIIEVDELAKRIEALEKGHA